MSFEGEEHGRIFIMQIASSFYEGIERPRVTDYLIGVDQKIPDWLMKIRFLGEAETASRSGIKSMCVCTGF